MSEKKPPPLPEHADLHDPDRKSRTHVVGLRTFDREYLIELSDGSVLAWSMLPQLRELLRPGRG